MSAADDCSASSDPEPEVGKKRRLLPFWLQEHKANADYQAANRAWYAAERKKPRKFPGFHLNPEQANEQVHVSFQPATSGQPCGTYHWPVGEDGKRSSALTLFVHTDEKTPESERLAHFRTAMFALPNDIESMAFIWNMDQGKQQTREKYSARRTVISEWMIAHPGIWCCVYQHRADDPDYAMAKDGLEKDVAKRPKKRQRRGTVAAMKKPSAKKKQNPPPTVVRATA